MLTAGRWATRMRPCPLFLAAGLVLMACVSAAAGDSTSGNIVLPPHPMPQSLPWQRPPGQGAPPVESGPALYGFEVDAYYKEQADRFFQNRNLNEDAIRQFTRRFFVNGKMPGWLWVFRSPEDCQTWAVLADQEYRQCHHGQGLPMGWRPNDAIAAD